MATPNPNFQAAVELAPGDSVDFYFEVDLLPSFDGGFLQRSSDKPLLFEVLWHDMRFTGDRKDDDGDLNIATIVADVEPEGLGGQLGLAEGDPHPRGKRRRTPHTPNGIPSGLTGILLRVRTRCLPLGSGMRRPCVEPWCAGRGKHWDLSLRRTRRSSRA